MLRPTSALILVFAASQVLAAPDIETDDWGRK
jgi:hypothetical protein